VGEKPYDGKSLRRTHHLQAHTVGPNGPREKHPGVEGGGCLLQSETLSQRKQVRRQQKLTINTYLKRFAPFERAIKPISKKRRGGHQSKWS